MRFGKLTILLLTLVIGLVLNNSAKADTVNIFSSGADPNQTNNFAGAGTDTIAITPNPQWAAALPGSDWVSFAQTGTPNPTPPPNTTAVRFTQLFNLSGTATSGSITVRADDTVAVFLNGTKILNENTSTNPNDYPACSNTAPGCLTSTQSVLSFSTLQPFLLVGQNEIVFQVFQRNLSSYGLNYAGSITTVPEPASMFLLGTGIAGIGAALRKRRKANNAE